MTDYLPRAELVFELDVNCEAPTMLGRSGGGDAMMIPINGGTVRGRGLNGEVLAGGADWAIKRDDGFFCVDARYAIKAEDGTIIQVFNRGTNRLDLEANPSMTMLTTPSFIAPDGSHAWLNDTVFVGTVAPNMSKPSTVHVAIFKMV